MNDLKHLAIIMDGNGRWATQRGKNRFWGHMKGTENAQDIIEFCAKETSIKYLTLYAFSTENWKRPKKEVDFLFDLLEKHLDEKRETLISKNIKLRVVGALEALPNGLNQQIEKVVEESQNNTGLNLTFALNYGGRQEILKAVNTYCKNNSTPLTEQEFSSLLETSEIPDPDLMIRTSGEKRISNFLLWQSAYTELYFTDRLWPDFSTADLVNAINSFEKRTRKYGGLGNTIKPSLNL